jgi:hypothetical protein
MTEGRCIMASVFKRGRWVDANGRKCTKDAAGATWAESRYYTIKLHLPGDRIKFVVTHQPSATPFGHCVHSIRNVRRLSGIALSAWA